VSRRHLSPPETASDSFEAVFCRTAGGDWSPEIDAHGRVAIGQR
jgi:hypothetical protein